MPRRSGKKQGDFAGNPKYCPEEQIVLRKRPIAVMVLVHVQEEKGCDEEPRNNVITKKGYQ